MGFWAWGAGYRVGGNGDQAGKSLEVIWTLGCNKGAFWAHRR